MLLALLIRGIDDNQLQQTLHGFLAAPRDVLTSLTVRFDSFILSEEMVHVLGILHYPNLAKVRLEAMWFDESTEPSSLHTFLTHHPSLHHVYLHQIDLWSCQWVSVLKLFLDFGKLRSVYMGALSEEGNQIRFADQLQWHVLEGDDMALSLAFAIANIQLTGEEADTNLADHYRQFCEDSDYASSESDE